MPRPPNIPKRPTPAINKNNLAAQQAQFAKLFESALALHKEGQFQEALAMYEQLQRIRPNQFAVLQLIGALFAQTQHFEQAVEYLTKALRIDPNQPAVHSNLGFALKALKRFDEALAFLDRALELDANYSEAHNNRANVLKDLNQLAEALAGYDRAIELKPGFAEAHNNRGSVLKDLNRLEEALASYDRAVTLNPAYADAFHNRGLIQHQLNRWEDALKSYQKAIALKPTLADAYFNLGNTLRAKKRLEFALANYDKAVELKPDFADAFTNRGLALQELKRFDEALINNDQAIAIDPSNQAAHNNRGIVLQELRRLAEALVSYDKAIALNADYANAHHNRGVLLQELKRLDEAVASYETALRLKPDYPQLAGTLQNAKMHMGDWAGADQRISQICEQIQTGKLVATPFLVLAFSDSLAIQKAAVDVVVKNLYPVNELLGAIPERSRQAKIRIGYFSADFRHHAVSYLIAELFELHDRSRFEIIAFSLKSAQPEDPIKQRLAKAFDRFIEVADQSDQEIAQLSRSLGIDIAVDLGGHTQFARTGIFAYRTAPIQVNYLGYPGTMAASYIDYIVADHTLIPASARHHYSEKIVYMPNSYQANDSKRSISDKRFTRHELGLPENTFVFACFNNNYKILPKTFDSWMKILKAVSGSVLWLLETNSFVASNLKKEAAKREVDPDRLIFAKSMPLPDHLARHRQADLFIDTLPYNAHTTASDALWAGLPVLTLMGESFAGRVAASLLKAVQLPELMTDTQASYEALAIELATNSQKLNAIKQKLSDNRLTTQLFDTPQFTKDLEAFYLKMMERYWAKLPPEHLFADSN